MRMISASNPANTNAARSTQANDRMINGGGSCGSISDSVSMLPRLPDKIFTEVCLRSRVAGWTDSNRDHVAPSVRREFPLQPRSLFPAQLWRALREWCLTDARLQSWCVRTSGGPGCPESPVPTRCRARWSLRRILERGDYYRWRGRLRCAASVRRIRKDRILRFWFRILTEAA